ncbi:MAG: hypothetical protein QOD13_672, partial [Thermoleophilaceae bacterium]|nr:hypothetical protein [Thermoleophilaceae bacterium]
AAHRKLPLRFAHAALTAQLAPA